MNMIEKEKYDAPEVFVESYVCERGFENSPYAEFGDADGDPDFIETI